ncbi:MAG: class I adenylate-forming enzyme family protein [Halieaceae bacterium]|nr:class I adenylate-forming enzyme family protein [Halieaceae bacterium]
MNLANDLERRAAENGGRVALIFEDGQKFSFDALNDDSNRAALVFSKLGIKKSDRVALYLRNRPPLVRCLFALWKIGAVPVTISSLYGKEEFLKAAETSNPVMIVADEETLTRATSSDIAIPCCVIDCGKDRSLDFDNIDTMASKLPENSLVADLPSGGDAVILFTGGTTGEPKAVSMTHDGTFETMSRLAKFSKGGKKGPYPLADEERPPNLVPLPLFHSGGQQALLFAFHVGRSVLMIEKFSGQLVSKFTSKYRLDNLFLLPTMLFDLVHLSGDADLSSVRSVLVAGGEISSTLRARFEERYKIPLLTNYGSTETGHVAGWTSIDVRSGHWIPGSAGRIYNGVEVEIRNEQGAPLKEAREGEIFVRTNVSSGYVAESDDQLIDKDGWIASGDIGYITSDNILFLVGRKREMIKCGGFQVWPLELEEILREHPSVSDVAVIGTPDDRLGEIPTAFVVRSIEKNAPATKDELINFTREHLAHYKALRKVEFVDGLPRTMAGKIDRQALKTQIKH